MGAFKLALAFGRRGYESRFGQQSLYLLSTLQKGTNPAAVLGTMIDWSLSWHAEYDLLETLGRVLEEGIKDTAVLVRAYSGGGGGGAAAKARGKTTLSPVGKTLDIVERLFQAKSQRLSEYLILPEGVGTSYDLVGSIVDMLEHIAEHLSTENRRSHGGILLWNKERLKRKQAETLIKRAVGCLSALAQFVEGAGVATLQHMLTFPSLITTINSILVVTTYVEGRRTRIPACFYPSS